MNILVVDDSKLIRSLIIKELRLGNYSITEAENGQKALDLLSKNSYDLITLDVEMPGINGFDVCREFRAQELKTKEASELTPILFVTGNDTLKDRVKGFEAGATDFFEKPFQTGELLEAVEKIFAPDLTFHEKTILVVDDSPLICQILETALGGYNITTVVAENGQQAFDILKSKSHKIDLVITDYEMPEMKGDILCRHIRTTLDLADMPVIFLTGASMTEYILSMFHSGASDLINKPFSKEELFARINVHLRELNLKQDLNNKILQLEEAKAKLEVMAVTDGLTGLFNHKHIFELLDLRLVEAERNSQPLSVLLLDIDHFKSVNDRFGHQRGDEVLVEVSKAIKSCVRVTDLASRYGGEEFLIIFPNTNIKGARQVAEKIRSTVEQLVWQDEGLEIRISGGVCAYDKQTTAKLIESSDQLLYDAKNAGRNQILG
jgi:two-component system, cell cycle response regulator